MTTRRNAFDNDILADLGINSFETELARHGVLQKNSRPNHPTTCGKVERFHQTLKKWLTGQPRATAIDTLQHQLDEFVEIYNHHRPHRSLPHSATPATIYKARPKAVPAPADHDAHYREVGRASCRERV